jgi:hypothetical protein
MIKDDVMRNSVQFSSSIWRHLIFPTTVLGSKVGGSVALAVGLQQFLSLKLY